MPVLSTGRGHDPLLQKFADHPSEQIHDNPNKIFKTAGKARNRMKRLINSFFIDSCFLCTMGELHSQEIITTVKMIGRLIPVSHKERSVWIERISDDPEVKPRVPE
jgi:hypothetical protein